MHQFCKPCTSLFHLRFGFLRCIIFKGFDGSCWDTKSHSNVQACDATNRTLGLEDVPLHFLFGCLWCDFS